MIETGSGVKGLIFKNGEILVLVKPNGRLDFPGGRVEPGESSKNTLYRETNEETGLNIDIQKPVCEWFLIKDSGRLITGITYVCSFLGGRICLSREHAAYFWSQLFNINDPDLTRWLNNERLIGHYSAKIIPVHKRDKKLEVPL